MPLRESSVTIISWVASLTIAAVILYTSALNVVYLVEYSNVVHEEASQIYAADRDWVFGAENSGGIDIEIVYTFLSSSEPQAAVDLRHAFLKESNKLSMDMACVGRLGEDGGSIYGFCDKLDYSRLPTWAKNFEAINIQSVYLSSPQEFRDGLASSYVGIMQSYKSDRKGWFNQEGIERMYCTTEHLARPVSKFVQRTIYTISHGV